MTYHVTMFFPHKSRGNIRFRIEVISREFSKFQFREFAKNDLGPKSDVIPRDLWGKNIVKWYATQVHFKYLLCRFGNFAIFANSGKMVSILNVTLPHDLWRKNIAKWYVTQVHFRWFQLVLMFAIFRGIRETANRRKIVNSLLCMKFYVEQ
jgi:hypothetical protein